MVATDQTIVCFIKSNLDSDIEVKIDSEIFSFAKIWILDSYLNKFLNQWLYKIVGLWLRFAIFQFSMVFISMHATFLNKMCKVYDTI